MLIVISSQNSQLARSVIIAAQADPFCNGRECHPERWCYRSLHTLEARKASATEAVKM